MEIGTRMYTLRRVVLDTIGTWMTRIFADFRRFVLNIPKF
jgi:hypothetical protein